MLLVDNFNAGFSVGEEVFQPLTGTTGLITKIDNDNQSLYVRPYSYYGFKSGGSDQIVYKGNSYDLISVVRDYSSKKFGENAIVTNRTEFSQGKIAAVKIRSSGFGYVSQEKVYLIDKNGNRKAEGILNADSQGITSGFWGSQSSHINGYRTNEDSGVFEYYDSKQKVQDSDYYQEYSYDIKSTVSVNRYEDVLKNTMHLSGTKMFGNFTYKKSVGPTLTHKFSIRVKDDYIVGGSDIVGPNQDVGDQTVRADSIIYSVDSGNITADNA